jgi:hypothetical protein
MKIPCQKISNDTEVLGLRCRSVSIRTGVAQRFMAFGHAQAVRQQVTAGSQGNVQRSPSPAMRLFQENSDGTA